MPMAAIYTAISPPSPDEIVALARNNEAKTYGANRRTLGRLAIAELVAAVVPPSHVNLKITYTEPAVRGNTSSNITKAATVEGGGEIQVPAFVNDGDVVRIDTRTGQYVERVKQ